MSIGKDKVRYEQVPEYQEDLLGLPYPVTLRGGVVRKVDTETGETLGYAIADLDGLVAAVAMIRALHNVKLSGDEIRFIRKAADMSAKSLANEIYVDPSTFSRWENGSQTMNEHIERLFRLYICDTLAKRAPAIDYESKEIATMKILNAWEGGQYPLIDVCRIKFKNSATRISSPEWDREHAVAYA